MFADSMEETSWAQRSRRRWITFTSLALQAVATAILLTLPLIRNTRPPSAHVLSAPVTWGPPPAVRPITQRRHFITIVQSNLSNNVLVAPRQTPRAVAMIKDVAAPPQVNFADFGVPGGTGVGSPNGVWKSLVESLNRPAIPPSPAPATITNPPRISHMNEGNLIRRVQSEYPALARSARIQGAVVMSAIISKEGRIENLRVVSGHPMLVRAAIDAVSQWRYRPYVLNSEPVEVETEITVNFSLSGN
jgi:periplasmic protein TonB